MMFVVLSIGFLSIIGTNNGQPMNYCEKANIVFNYTLKIDERQFCIPSFICDTVLMNFRGHLFFTRESCNISRKQDPYYEGWITYNQVDLGVVYPNQRDFQYTFSTSETLSYSKKWKCSFDWFTLDLWTSRSTLFWFKISVNVSDIDKYKIPSREVLNVTYITEDFRVQLYKELLLKWPQITNVSPELWLTSPPLQVGSSVLFALIFEWTYLLSSYTETMMVGNLTDACNRTKLGACSVTIVSMGDDFQVSGYAQVYDNNKPYSWDPVLVYTTSPPYLSTVKILVDLMMSECKKHNSSKSVLHITTTGFQKVNNSVNWSFLALISKEQWVNMYHNLNGTQMLQLLNQDFAQRTSDLLGFSLMVKFTTVNHAVLPTTPVPVITTTTAASRLFTTSVYSVIGAALLAHLMNFLSHMI